ncbi:MAG: YceI family protein [Bacteroidota bacterium]
MAKQSNPSWRLNQQKSQLSFEIRNAGFKVKGSFSGLEAEIQLSEDQPEKGRIQASLSVATINTRNSLRDSHLKQADYFYVQKHPKIIFQSEEILKDEQGYRALGSLAIRGIRRQVEIPFQIKAGNNGILMEGNFELNRLDYKVGSPSFILDKKVTVFIQAYIEQAS